MPRYGSRNLTLIEIIFARFPGIDTMAPTRYFVSGNGQTFTVSPSRPFPSDPYCFRCRLLGGSVDPGEKVLGHNILTSLDTESVVQYKALFTVLQIAASLLRQNRLALSRPMPRAIFPRSTSRSFSRSMKYSSSRRTSLGQPCHCVGFLLIGYTRWHQDSSREQELRWVLEQL